MEKSDLNNRDKGSGSRALSTITIIISVVFVAMSCSESGINSTERGPTGDNLSAKVQQAPTVINSGSDFSAFSGLDMPGDYLMKSHNNGNSAAFSTPLFGLATAPNGDILVADAGRGIATQDAHLEIPLMGVSDMAPIGRNSMWALVGLSEVPGDDTGQALYRVSKGKNHMLVDLFDYEAKNNPDDQLIDSNPFDVHSLGGDAALVADAAGNDLLRIDNQGNIELLAIFPNELVSTSHVKSLVGCPGGPPDICGLPETIPAQPVPTSVTVGPDGYYYVGELKGFPAPTDESNIWRVAPGAFAAECGTSADCQKVFDGGFTSIIDMAFDSEGNLYVVELDENSWFAVEFGGAIGGTINKCDVDAGTCSEVASGIPIITAITFGKDGTLWATQNALIPGAASVVQITP